MIAFLAVVSRRNYCAVQGWRHGVCSELSSGFPATFHLFIGNLQLARQALYMYALTVG